MNPPSILLVASLVGTLTASCATTSAPSGLWRERVNVLLEASDASGRTLCLEFGQFQLEPSERVVMQTDTVVTIAGPSGEFSIHRNQFNDEIPEPVALANRDLFGGFYRYDKPQTGYVASVSNPFQEGELFVAWLEGPAMTGEVADSSIYSRYFPGDPRGDCQEAS